MDHEKPTTLYVGEERMGKNKKWVQVIIILAVVVVGGYTVFSNSLEDTKVPRIGDEAPDFTLRGLDGQQHSLVEYRGRAVLINFWGSYCPPCVREMPAIQKIHDEYKNRPFEVLGVNLDESIITVRGFVGQFGVTFPILLDKNVVRKQYGVTAYPTSFFVNPQGEITAVKEGEMTVDYIRLNLQDILPNNN